METVVFFSKEVICATPETVLPKIISESSAELLESSLQAAKKHARRIKSV